MTDSVPESVPDTAPDTVAGRVRHALTDVLALVYLGVCAALLIWALVVTALDDSGESMAGVIPLLATAPASLVVLALPDHVSMIVLAIAFGALVNATVIGWCSRVLRGSRRGSR
ncbi:SCO4225 family membrane protein [Streptomyces sp. T028]|uniref:SCO4225 family membrane protein n=1 Tax=Streptomyces sp. T028 TaxID=3394379 RepID=UPI003A8C0717